jgi:hypothetical protein
MTRSTRFVMTVAILLLVVRVLACQSNGGSGGQPPADGGSAGQRPSDGGAGAGGTAGEGCGATGFAGFGSLGGCGPDPICDGKVVVQQAYCDQFKCWGAVATVTRTACADGTACDAGRCVTRAFAPSKTCSSPLDCGLPRPVCVGATEQMTFSDPTCDEGQCHWKQIIDACGSFMFGEFLCDRDGKSLNRGQCYDPGGDVKRTGLFTPMPTADPIQLPAPPAQTCSKASDCAQPPTACFKDSVVSYVNPACQVGACDWEVDLSQCGTSCAEGGVCAAP